MADERLEERLARLERERQEADQRYNDALTALDRAQQRHPALSDPPPPYDTTRLPEANETWDVLPDGPPVIDRSLKGRLRGFIWRLVGPSIETQRRLNSALVDHLNRNAGGHEQTHDATTRLLAAAAEQAEQQVRFQTHLIQLLQTVTAYVDTKDRATAGGQHILNEGLSVVTGDWLKRWESLSAREERFAQRHATLTASLDDLRRTTTLAQDTALSLKRDVERLLAVPPRAGSAAPVEDDGGPDSQAPVVGHGPDLEASKYLGFENQFRGSPEYVRDRMVAYVPLFGGLSDVLDLGCGRGEFLELLRTAGIAARGVDLNHAMAEASRALGLDVTEADALTYLAGLPDESLGGVFAAQVVEHLPPTYLMTLLETAAHKVRPGGIIVLETINPACWLAFFDSYIRDLTHVQPIHPETLQYLLRVSGFHDVSIEFTSPVAEEERLRTLPDAPTEALPEVADLVDTFNDNVGKLNSRIFTFRDYAVVGRK